MGIFRTPDSVGPFVVYFNIYKVLKYPRTNEIMEGTAVIWWSGGQAVCCWNVVSQTPPTVFKLWNLLYTICIWTEGKRRDTLL